MADNENTATENPTAKAAPKVAFSVEKNNITLDFLDKVKQRGDDKPAADAPFALLKGSHYYTPNVTKENFNDQVIPWFGLDTIVKIVAAKANQYFMGLTEGVLEAKEGTFDQDLFSKWATEPFARGETITSINEAIADRLEEFSDLAEKYDPTNMEEVGKLGELAKEIKTLRAAAEAKKRPKTPAEATAVAA